MRLTTDFVTDIEQQSHLYLSRMRQIDKILEGPAKTLIRLAKRGKEESDAIQSPAKALFYFPTWISEASEPEKKDYLLTQSVCCATLQRLWRLRRRFTWLDTDSYGQLAALHSDLENVFNSRPLDFAQSMELLYSRTLGGLNPLTASQVFRVLMEAGEDRTHAGLGFLAFFAMVWPLCRRFPDRLTIGIRIEPWEVTAYGTAKCLIPIKILQKVIRTRARLLEHVDENLEKLEKLAPETSSRSRWEFNVQLDELVANLRHLSKYSIDQKAFEDCAEAVEKESVAESSNHAIYANVLKHIGSALLKVRDKSATVSDDANTMVSRIGDEILKPLTNVNANRLNESKDYKALTDLGLIFSEEHKKNKDYWRDLSSAALDAKKYCDKALKVLETARNICPGVTSDFATIDRSTISTALKDLATANRSIGRVIDEPVKDAARWCRNVVDREIAHASAENLTDFDPSELVSAIAVAVAWNLMTTPLQVSDAVTKAIAGARADGSWRSGKPFYSPNYAFGLWAGTSDIVWTLTSAIEQFPEVREADDELFNYVNWLERTQVTLKRNWIAEPKTNHQPDKPIDEDIEFHDERYDYIGWASERLRDRRKINLGTTSFSINALLEIRDLVEYRLWQLCKRRFSVVSIDKVLKEIEPVDLGAAHSKRLHRRLARMVRETQGSAYDKAEYSLLLHGPPGSSKTKMAEALSAEMWKSSGRWGAMKPRLLRITPADFTRLGEDRLDSEARIIFDLISGVRAVTIFFDEIDDLLRQRNISGKQPRFMDLVTPAMLNRLADLRSACPRQEICFLLGTNYVENIDLALIRRGRIDDTIPVVYPDFESRVSIISSYKPKDVKQSFPTSPGEFEMIARTTAGWPYLHVLSCCDRIARTYNCSGQDRFERILKRAVLDHESRSTSTPYEKRQRVTGELFDEYLHHLISCSENRQQCRQKLRESAEMYRDFPNHILILECILDKEERWLNETREWG